MENKKQVKQEETNTNQIILIYAKPIESEDKKFMTYSLVKRKGVKGITNVKLTEDALSNSEIKSKDMPKEKGYYKITLMSNEECNDIYGEVALSLSSKVTILENGTKIDTLWIRGGIISVERATAYEEKRRKEAEERTNKLLLDVDDEEYQALPF